MCPPLSYINSKRKQKNRKSRKHAAEKLPHKRKSRAQSARHDVNLVLAEGFEPPTPSM